VSVFGGKYFQLETKGQARAPCWLARAHVANHDHIRVWMPTNMKKCRVLHKGKQAPPLLAGVIEHSPRHYWPQKGCFDDERQCFA